jgi:hypothetical protein
MLTLAKETLSTKMRQQSAIFIPFNLPTLANVSPRPKRCLVENVMEDQKTPSQFSGNKILF